MDDRRSEDRIEDLLSLFQKLVSHEVLDEFDVGNSRIFAAWVVVWLMVYQRLRKGGSLAMAVAELTEGVTSRKLPVCKRTRDGKISANTSAYSQARSDLSRDAAERVVDVVSQTLIASRGLLWKGRRVFLFDGTTITLEHRPELVKAYPPTNNLQGSSPWPVVLVVTAHELTSGLAMRPHYGPMYGDLAVSETELARRSLAELKSPAMIVSDRNFGIFSLTHAAVDAGHDVLVRMTDARFKAVLRQAEQVRPGEWRILWRPSAWDLKRNREVAADAAVRGRLIEAKIVHETKTIVLRLFTTDMSSSVDELVALYGKRWLIEDDIRNLKQTLGMKWLSGRSVDMVDKEILLGIAAYNLVIEVRRLAADRAQVEARRLSFRRILYLVQAYASVPSATETTEEANARFERLLIHAGQCRLPNRKKFRSYPREVIQRRQQFPKRKIGSVRKN